MNLRRCFPAATQQQCDEFHRLSNAIPRVQGYALEKDASEIEAVLAALRPNGKTVENLIDSDLLTASIRQGDSRFHEKICPAMLALPRPVPVQYVAMLANTTEQAIRDFCIDMFPGIRLRGGASASQMKILKTISDSVFHQIQRFTNRWLPSWHLKATKTVMQRHI